MSEEFIVYECPVRGCTTIVDSKITKENGRKYICGIPKSVCDGCKSLGYSCESGMGNGRTNIYQNDELKYYYGTKY
jgi:hypothetical protein